MSAGARRLLRWTLRTRQSVRPARRLVTGPGRARAALSPTCWSPRAVDDGFLADHVGEGLGWLGLLAVATLVGAWGTRQTTLQLAEAVEPFRDDLVALVTTGTLRRSARLGCPSDMAGVPRLTEQVEIARVPYAAVVMFVQTFAVTAVSVLLGLAALDPALLLFVAAVAPTPSGATGNVAAAAAGSTASGAPRRCPQLPMPAPARRGPGDRASLTPRLRGSGCRWTAASSSEGSPSVTPGPPNPSSGTLTSLSCRAPVWRWPARAAPGSTLAALVAGVLEPQSGLVLLGGAPARSPGRDPWADAHAPSGSRALIPQEAYVFTGTLREKPGLPPPHGRTGRPRLGRRRHRSGPPHRALGGYDAPVDPALLSAGERQLIALVRALPSPARLLLLDEATRHLAPAAEAVVEHAFAIRPATLIVCAHRIRSALRADLVLVLDGPRHHLGTHGRLMADCALYRDLLDHWDHTTTGTPGAAPAAARTIRPTRPETSPDQ